MKEKLLIAKSGSDSSKWLPLWMHLKDTAGIMEYLLEEFVCDSFCEACGMDKQQLNKTAKFLAFVHDIGKATTAFQYKISNNVAQRTLVMEHYGLILPDKMDNKYIQDTPHALAGEVILRYYGYPKGIATVVGAHHGIPAERANIRSQSFANKSGKIMGCRNYFGDNKGNREFLEMAWESITSDALKEAELDSKDELTEISPHAQMQLSGLLIMADWIASNTEFFPLIAVEDDADESEYPKRVEAAWEKACFPKMWESSRETYSDTEFANVFDFAPRDTQKAMLKIVEETACPGIMILEAPMGCGKTEAALSAAEILAAKLGKNGLFFGLPTQATANGIFPRIQHWGEKQSEEEYHAIQLKHSSAELNEVFQKIQRGIPNEKNDSGLIVHSWFCNNKKACLANFVIATVDQMLMSALKRRHVMLLHLGLSEKVVIIDEVHAYDAYMNQYLERALQWLGVYHTPVILLSATLPAQRRMSLVNAYLNGGSDKSFEQNNCYPLLTWTDSGVIKQQNLPYTGEHKTVTIKKCHDADILAMVEDVVKSGGCVGIIMNTVNRAQKEADAVRSSITKNVFLYHAQYIMPHRAEKEQELIKLIGKNSTSQTRKGFVVIGTQVLEQSLDIDFDMLITDICPMDLILQRIGRLHRHERDYRPDIVKEPVCCVVTDEYENEKTGSKIIYGEWLLKETLAQLPGKVTLPDDISLLVQQVYGANDKSEEYEKYVDGIKISQELAQAFLLDEPDNSVDDTIHDLLVKDIKTNDDSKAEASVRDSISSVEVVVMQRYSDGRMYFLDGMPLSGCPSDKEYERIANQKLKLPSRFCQKWNIDRTISELENKCKPYVEQWQNSYWLAGKLAMFLDENMETELAGCNLKYSYENGLQFKGEKEKDE